MEAPGIVHQASRSGSLASPNTAAKEIGPSKHPWVLPVQVIEALLIAVTIGLSSLQHMPCGLPLID